MPSRAASPGTTTSWATRSSRPGDRAGAAAAYADALVDDPTSHLAHWGLARVAAADGRIDEAIAQLDAAIAVVPLPEFVARRADLYGAARPPTGDAKREANDRKTVLAIAQLSGEAAGVYDRTLSLYLSTTAIDPARALTLAQAEIGVRKDVYGYDALAWALLANGRAAEADAAMADALAFGTRDAKLLYHAGMIAAAVGDPGRARAQMQDALALDASFDPVGAQRRARYAVATAMRRRLLAGLAFAWVAALGRARRSRARIRSATSRSTTTPGSGSSRDRVLLDVVIDQAEIPAFQARLEYDTDGDGEVSRRGDRRGPARRLRRVGAGAPPRRGRRGGGR